MTEEQPSGRLDKGINRVVDTDREGRPVTAGQKVIERVGQAMVVWGVAAGSAGIDPNTLMEWRRQGARARAKAVQGELLSPDETTYADWLAALETAENEAELRRLAMIQREGQGGYPITKEVVKTDAEGNVLERTVTTETARPIWQALAWQLERRHPSRYGRRFEVSGPEGEAIPIEVRARRLTDELMDHLARAAAEASDDLPVLDVVPEDETERGGE